MSQSRSDHLRPSKREICFNPAGAIVQAILTIYNTVMFFIERINQILDFVEAIVSSIFNIATGKIDAAANWIEKALARTIPLIIAFLARLLGLGGLSDTIKEIIKKIQTVVDKAIDMVIAKVVAGIKKLFGKGKADERTDEQKKADLEKAMAEGQQVIEKRGDSTELIELDLHKISTKYRMTSYMLVTDSEDDSKITLHLEGQINPDKKTPSKTIMKEKWDVGMYEQLKASGMQSHHVPVNVLRTWIADSLETIPNKKFKNKAKDLRDGTYKDGKGLSAILVPEAVHKQIHHPDNPPTPSLLKSIAEQVRDAIEETGLEAGNNVPWKMVEVERKGEATYHPWRKDITSAASKAFPWSSTKSKTKFTGAVSKLKLAFLSMFGSLLIQGAASVSKAKEDKPSTRSRLKKLGALAKLIPVAPKHWREVITPPDIQNDK